MSYNKYKDLPPEKTIENLRRVLNDLGCFPEETFIQMIDNVWCGWITDHKHLWNTNGKGTTKEYCMASAYGEALERLQNMMFSAPWVYASKDALEYKNFYKFKDEQILSVKEALQLNNYVLQDAILLFLISEGRTPYSINELASYWEEELPDNYKLDSNSICVPYYSVKQQKEVLLPLGIISCIVGTNGESSGNTPEEALLQGFSELLERYAEKYCAFNNLTPPEVPKQYIENNYPELFKSIKDIENLKEGYKVVVYDFSLGKSLPVLGIVLIDTILQRYRFQFGAHPLFNIALERCLTEMLQGYRPGDNKHDTLFLTPWTLEYTNKSLSSKNNDSRFTNGIGSLPDSFFRKNPSWEFKVWPNQDNFSNKLGLKEIINTTLNISEDIFIRDNSFLGVPSYSIYIPNISLSYYALGWKELNNKYCKTILSQCDENIDFFTIEEKYNLLNYLENTCTEDIMYCNCLTENVVKAALYLDTNQPLKAIELLRTYPYYEQSFKVAAKDIELSLSGYEESDRDNMISLFFGENYIEDLNKIWRTETVFENLFKHNKTGESDIIYRNGYDIDEESLKNNISSLLKKIKDKMVEKDIKQINLKNILQYD